MKRIGLLLFVAITACRRETPQSDAGDARRGRALMSVYGCNACHTIPGVPGEARVGPSLEKMARRAYIAGRLPNIPQHMIDWLRAPQSIDRGNAMPNLGVTERDARDMTAYLFTLR